MPFVVFYFILISILLFFFFFFFFYFTSFFFFFFFFSSRRRHTRLTCDWSSDVCSSDLACGTARTAGPSPRGCARPRGPDPTPDPPLQTVLDAPVAVPIRSHQGASTEDRKSVV